jgi:hypothetical protein
MFLRTGQNSRSRYVGATQDLSIAWHVEPTTQRAVLGSVLLGVGHTFAKHGLLEEHSVFFGNSELQVLKHKLPAALLDMAHYSRMTG